ncbi:MAG: hypothetical protein II275_09425, partial [Bacteroidaceae bacterium]|nr:hypothetical protein [Bacteroidaceae bacterium]
QKTSTNHRKYKVRFATNLKCKTPQKHRIHCAVKKELLPLHKLKSSSEKQMPLREPDLLIVLTGGEIAYTREDGVKIIPLGCLKD